MGVVVQAVAVVLLAAAPKGVMTLGGVAFCFGLLMADDSAVLIAGLMMEAGGSAVLDFWIVFLDVNVFPLALHSFSGFLERKTLEEDRSDGAIVNIYNR
jgi:hypothetical protein